MSPYDDMGINKGQTVKREYRLGGMTEPGITNEVVAMISQIDGVQEVNFDERSRNMAIRFDSGKVTEDHITGTLNSLGHSILDPE